MIKQVYVNVNHLSEVFFSYYSRFHQHKGSNSSNLIFNNHLTVEVEAEFLNKAW